MQVIHKQENRGHKITFSYVIERLYKKISKFLYSLVTLDFFLRIHRENLEIIKILKNAGKFSKEQNRQKFWIYTFGSSIIVYSIVELMNYNGISPGDYSHYFLILIILGLLPDFILFLIRSGGDYRRDEEIELEKKMNARPRH